MAAPVGDDIILDIDVALVNPHLTVSLPFYDDVLGLPLSVTGRLFDFRFCGYRLLLVPYILGHFSTEFIRDQFAPVRADMGTPLHIHNSIYQFMQASLRAGTVLNPIIAAMDLNPII